MKRFLSPVPVAVAACVVALLALLAYGVASTGTDDGIEDALARGEREEAPAIRLDRLGADGKQSLEDYRGKVVLLNYWASWCDPCREESPLLETWHQRMTKQDGTVLGIDVQDTSGDALDFVDEYDLTYPHLKDGPGDTMSDYGVAGIPESFLIDRQGRIAAIRRGPVTEAWLQEHVPPILGEGTGG